MSYISSRGMSLGKVHLLTRIVPPKGTTPFTQAYILRQIASNKSLAQFIGKNAWQPKSDIVTFLIAPQDYMFMTNTPFIAR